jgi:hypothetical protein
VDTVEDTDQIHADQGLPRRGVGSKEEIGSVETCVVHETVDASESLDGAIAGCTNRIAVADVALEEDARAPGALDLCDYGNSSVAIDVADGNRESLGAQAESDRLSEARSRSGDQGIPVGAILS